MNRLFHLALLAGAFFTIAAAPAQAGPGDASVPSISNSQSTRALFIGTGIVKNNGLETAFICTSLDVVDTTIAVEIFDPDTGAVLNNVATGTGNGAILLPAGATRTISTGTTVGLHEDVTISGLLNVKNGAARVLGTSSRVVCTALLVEKNGATPATVSTIKLFARRKQNGD